MAVELHARSLVADGVARVFLLTEPAGAPAGIILSLHGSTSTAAAQSRLTGMHLTGSAVFLALALALLLLVMRRPARAVGVAPVVSNTAS
jgi:poly(3-hydroxybutyrate) depolymerase